MANNRRRMKYRELVRRLRKYGVYVDAKRGKGSHRMLCKDHDDGRLSHTPITCHKESQEYPPSVILAILYTFSIPVEEFWNK